MKAVIKSNNDIWLECDDGSVKQKICFIHGYPHVCNLSKCDMNYLQRISERTYELGLCDGGHIIDELEREGA